jgi:hypothetical protein
MGSKIIFFGKGGVAVSACEEKGRERQCPRWPIEPALPRRTSAKGLKFE